MVDRTRGCFDRNLSGDRLLSAALINIHASSLRSGHPYYYSMSFFVLSDFCPAGGCEGSPHKEGKNQAYMGFVFPQQPSLV